MSDDFREAMSKVLADTRRDVKAWLGATQFAAYSHDKHASKHAGSSDIALEIHASAPARSGELNSLWSDVQHSPVVWFEGVNRDLEAAFKNAEGALSNEWMKRRDSRHQGEDAKDEFAHAFESNVATIARLVLDAEARIDKGEMRETRAMAESLGWVRADLKKLVMVYEETFHELTMHDQPGSLLGLRATIMQGAERAF